MRTVFPAEDLSVSRVHTCLLRGAFSELWVSVTQVRALRPCVCVCVRVCDFVHVYTLGKLSLHGVRTRLLNAVRKTNTHYLVSKSLLYKVQQLFISYRCCFCRDLQKIETSVR